MPQLKVPLQHRSAAEGFLTFSAKLATKAAVHGFVLISDVTPQTGGGCEGALTFVAGKLLQNLAVQFTHMGNIVLPVRVARVTR